MLSFIELAVGLVTHTHFVKGPYIIGIRSGDLAINTNCLFELSFFMQRNSLLNKFTGRNERCILLGRCRFCNDTDKDKGDQDSSHIGSLDYNPQNKRKKSWLYDFSDQITVLLISDKS